MPSLVNPYVYASAGPWDPSDFTGVAAWLRADDLIAQADASVTSSWVDRIIGADFAQATGAKQPLFYKTTAARLIGGRPTVSFDGVDDLLRYAGTLGSPTSGHILVVCQINTLPAIAGGNAMIISSADESTNTRQAEVVLSRPVSDTLLMWLQRDNDTGDLLRGNTVLTTGTDYVLEALSSGTSTNLRVNGVAQTITVVGGVNNGDWTGDTTGRDSTIVGARKNNIETAWFAGDIAEVIWINDATISAGERTNFNAYILDLYGIAL